ncbi:MAG TPA: right-handed parallel beta-helix repeat-containing protein [Candidatus Nanoarchaeia archaeon]|nr:right-handed parallel beta-helix repeat-containing protein [Candidatus Nanoarchaeia archaeon]
MGVKKSLIYVALLVLTMKFITAVECGSQPTDGCTVSVSTTFDTGNYNLPNGINMLGNAITLDCNMSILDGTGGSDIGIFFNTATFSTVQGCTIKNYNVGIHVGFASDNNTFFNNTLSFNSYGLILDYLSSTNYVDNTYIVENVMSNNSNTGVLIHGSVNIVVNNNIINNGNYGVRIAVPIAGSNNITQNILSGNGVHAVFLDDDGKFNNVWDNDIADTNLTYTRTNGNKYCINNIPNRYSAGASGPGCDCLPLVDQLVINTEENYCSGLYNLPNGVRLLENNIAVDCNNATLDGTGASSHGIYLNGPDFITVNNCTLQNYATGIDNTFGSSDNIIRHNLLFNNSIGVGLYNNAGLGANNHYVHDNIVIDSKDRGIYVGGTNNHVENNTILRSANYAVHVSTPSSLSNITNNWIEDNAFGIYVDGTARNNNYSYNYILNSINYSFYYNDRYDNISAENNCWGTSLRRKISDSIYDYYDDPTKGIVYFEPYISGYACGPGVGILDIIPIQVVENVDLIRGKTTLVRVQVEFAEDPTNQTTVVTDLYVNGSLYDTNSTDFTGGQIANIDFMIPGSSFEYVSQVEFKAVLTTNITGFNDTYAKTMNVVETRDLNIVFVPVDNPTNFNQAVADSVDFMRKVYPLADDALIDRQKEGITISSISGPFKTIRALDRIYRSSVINNEFPDVAVGIVRSNWLQDVLGEPGSGLSYFTSRAVIAEEDFSNTVAHEAGHVYRLCDENSNSTWLSGRIIYACDNGDRNNDNQLDGDCEGDGCPTTSLEPLSGYPDNTILHNLMGDEVSNVWIANDSFNQLLDELLTPLQTQTASKRVLISGIYDNITKSIVFQSTYLLGQGSTDFIDSFTDGDFSLEFLNDSSIVTNMRFNLSYGLFSADGNFTETNESLFTFTVPYTEDINKILFKENNVIKNEINKTPNVPIVNINYPNRDTVLMGEIEILWNATDLDNDTLSYALVLNSESEGNSTLGLDLNETNYTFNFSTIPEGKDYSLNVLTTDGFNTIETNTNTFCVDTNISICGLKLLNVNQTTALFEFIVTNTLNTTQEDINWTFDVQEANITSTYNFNLTGGEDIFVYIEYTYSSTGNYQITATSSNVNFTDSQSINLTI